MAELYDTTKQNISLHIKNIFDEEELDEDSTVKEFLTVQQEGNRSVTREISFYNLDMISSFSWYEVNGIHFYFEENVEMSANTIAHIINKCKGEYDDC